MKENLSDADFSIGSPEAWDPVERENLEHRFLPIVQYTHIAEDEKIFLCGRRGSGKSAIALMLERSKDYSYTEAIQGEAEEYGSYMTIVRAICRKRDAGADIDVKKSIRRLWMWVLPVKAMQLVVKRCIENDEPLDQDIELIWQYLNSLPAPLHEESSIGHLLTNIFQMVKEQLEEGDENYDIALLNLSQSKEYGKALDALHRKTLKNPALLIIDTLESYRIFEGPMIEGLKGILEAVNALRGERRLEAVTLKFFMPAEIYNIVFQAFPGKVQSSAVFLRWNTPNLITMLARRFLDILSSTETVSRDQISQLEEAVSQAYKQKDGRYLRNYFWYATKFLPEKIWNRRGGYEDCFAYMFRHTQRRPRDILKQMQAIITEARRRNEFPYISVDSVVAGVHDEKTLSQILGDALAPYEGQLPVDLIDAARSAFYERSRIMTGRELKRFARELYNLHPIENVEVDEFVSTLVKCGVIGLLGDTPPQHEVETSQQGHETPLYQKAKFEYVIHCNLPIADRFTYCVHPVMGDVFHMPSPEDGTVIYPLPDDQADRWLEESVGITPSD